MDASGAGCGCPPHVRASRDSFCGAMRQPAYSRIIYAGFAAARVQPYLCSRLVRMGSAAQGRSSPPPSLSQGSLFGQLYKLN